MNIGLISHRTGNIGHAFMAAGVEAIVRHISGDRPIEITHIEQHRPLHIYPRWHPIRLFDHVPSAKFVGVKRWAVRAAKSQWLRRQSAPFVDRFDLVIDCGGPNIAPNVASAPEMQLQFPHLFTAFTSRDVPVVSLSNGSCYPLEAIPERIPNAEDEQFLQEVLGCVRAATVRDQVAAVLCAAVGHALPLIPCPALLSGSAYAAVIDEERQHRGREYIVVNFQQSGANEDWGQGVDFVAWQRTMQEVVRRLQVRHAVIFVCHNEREEALAALLDASIPAVRPRSLVEYFRVISRARAGICNRIHAAVPLASLGIPAVGVGTDTRLGTLDAIGFPTVYVKHATADLLESMVEDLAAKHEEEAERLRAVRERAIEQYAAVLGRFF